MNSVTHLSNNWAPGKERCGKAKSPVKGNNLTPRLEYGPLNVMFEVLPRYQSLRLYFLHIECDAQQVQIRVETR